MILITGATGQLGKAVVENLLLRVPADQVAVSVRDTDKARNLAARGVDVRCGDFDKPEGLENAFAGADQVLIVSADKLGDEAVRLHRAAINAARKAGAHRLLYTSHMGARLGSSFLPADQHALTERDLATGGAAYTSLRHGFYVESCLHMIGHDLKNGELRTPQDGPVSWTARADLAEADAAILASDGEWNDITPPLTASKAITMAELAVIASEVYGREIPHAFISDEEWLNLKIATGVPAFYAQMLLGTFRAARNGDFAATNPALATLLGRPPLTMPDVLKQQS
jgi:uncharacterized protein YbjT (DUF2867 family)